MTVNLIDIEPTYTIFAKYLYAPAPRGQADLTIMVNNLVGPTEIRSRPIAPSDHDAVAALLNKGFAFRRSRAFWQQLLDRLDRRAVPDGLPKCGYLLESAGRPVGAVLLIFATPRTGDDPNAIRCNISSWYVEPAFRSYASFLAAQAIRHRYVTYLNISPAPNTRPIIEAQGYKRYSNGLFIAVPALKRAVEPAHIVEADVGPGAPHEDFERDLLARHAGYGCLSFWCATAERAHPFVFRQRLFKGILPCAQLIYCRDIGDVARFAGLIGRHLLAAGCPFAIIDANGPLAGLIGHYFAGWKPKYFKGAVPPRLGDLADTEAALFGL
jgi:hypothetical protein